MAKNPRFRVRFQVHVLGSTEGEEEMTAKLKATYLEAARQEARQAVQKAVKAVEKAKGLRLVATHILIEEERVGNKRCLVANVVGI